MIICLSLTLVILQTHISIYLLSGRNGPVICNAKQMYEALRMEKDLFQQPLAYIKIKPD